MHSFAVERRAPLREMLSAITPYYIQHYLYHLFAFALGVLITPHHNTNVRPIMAHPSNLPPIGYECNTVTTENSRETRTPNPSTSRTSRWKLIFKRNPDPRRNNEDFLETEITPASDADAATFCLREAHVIAARLSAEIEPHGRNDPNWPLSPRPSEAERLEYGE